VFKECFHEVPGGKGGGGGGGGATPGHEKSHTHIHTHTHALQLLGPGRDLCGGR
jgi:hypothetical protein